MEIAESIGLESIQARASQLTEILRAEVSGWDGVKVLTPREPGKSAGITSLMFDGFTEADMNRLVESLYLKHDVLVKAQWLTAPPVPEKIAMRISIAAFNNEEEIYRLLAGLREESGL